MKTMKMFFTALVCFAAVACVNEKMDPQVSAQQEKGVFTGVRTDFGGNKTKTVLTEDYKVLWESDDAIAVWDGTEIYRKEDGSQIPVEALRNAGWGVGYKFVSTCTEDSESTGFNYSYVSGDNATEGYADISGGYELSSASGWYLMNSNYAANFICNVTDMQFRAWISGDQKIPEGTFVDSRDFAFAKTTDLSKPVVFKNAVSLMEFEVPADMAGKITNVVVTPNASGENFAGNILVDYSGDSPRTSLWASNTDLYNMDKKGSTRALTLTPASGETFDAGKYYAVVCPGSYTQGLTVAATLTSGMTLTRSSENPCTFKESIVYGMGDLGGEGYGVYSLSAQACETSSSTLAFSWTYGGEATFDVSRSYTIALYEDEACTELYVSHKVPANSAIWLGNVPKFCFAGLASNTAYYFKVTDTEGGVESAVVPSKTDEFTVVTMPSAPAQAGDVILAEDFSEITGQGEYVIRAAATYTSAGKKNFAPVTGEFPEVTLVACNYETKANFVIDNRAAYLESRLKDWGRSKSLEDAASFYAHPGCVKIGTQKAKAYLLTPVLSAIPEGKTATLTVTVTVARHSDVTSMNLLCACYDAGTMTDLVMDGDIPTSWKNSESLQYSTKNGISDKWTTYTLEIPNVKNTWRLMIGPGASAVQTAGRMYVSDVEVQIKSLADIQ